MQASLVLMIFMLFSSCAVLRSFFKQHPFQIKATVEGEIKGHKIYCEKTLQLGDGKWGLMCGVDNGLDIKYRVRPLSHEQTQVEFLVGKTKEGREKIIATPTLIVKKTESSRNTISSDSSYITVVAERIK